MLYELPRHERLHAVRGALRALRGGEQPRSHADHAIPGAGQGGRHRHHLLR